MKRLLFTILFLLLATQAHATRYWAATTGSDANACAAVDGAADPATYRTFSGAVSCATVSGDEVYLKAGTYTTSATISNPTSGITIRSESATPANWAVLQPTSGTAILDFTVARSNVTFQYIKLDGSQISNFNNGLRSSNGPVISNITLQDFEIKGRTATTNTSPAAVTCSSTSTGWIVRRGKIYDFSDDDSSPGAHGFYWRCDNGLIEHVEVTNVNGYGIQFYSSGGSPDNNVFRYNWLHGFTARGPIYIQLAAVNNAIYNNLMADFVGTQAVNFNGSGTYFVNNVIYDTSSVRGITISGCAANCVIANNIIAVGGTDIFGSDADITTSTNSTSAACMIDPANDNFNLVESSACIDAGTVINASGQWPGSTGRYVGAGVDRGAFEACVRSSAVVENATPTKYRVLYSCPTQSDRDGVGLQTPTVGNWVALVAGAPTQSSAAIVGSSIVEITLSAAVTNGQSLTDAMTRTSAPTLMDNVAIGDPNGTVNVNFFNAQVRSHSAASATNNVGGAGGVTYNVVHARQISWYSSTAAPSWKRIQDAAGGAQAGGRIALAITIEGTGADPDSTPFEVYFNTGGGDAAITDSVATNAIGFVNDAPTFQDQLAISSLLSGLTCPHATFVAGAVVGKQTTQPNINLSQNSCTTLIVLLQTKSDASGTINIKPKLPGGTEIGYGVTPSILIKKAEAGS